MNNTATALPPYLAMLGVDIRDFSGVPGRHQAEVTDAIPVVMRSAFERAGLEQNWLDKHFYSPSGDGCAIGLPTGILPFLVNPFLFALQDELDYRDQVRADPVPLRMRVSVHVGPVTNTGGTSDSEGSGAARIATHRLLDAQPVKDLLTRSGPTTRVAAIISARAFEDAVLTGYAGAEADRYVRVPVEVKTFRDAAYLRVPAPSGGLLSEGFQPRDDHAGTAADETLAPGMDAAAVTNHAREVHGQVEQSRDHNTTYTFNGENNNVNTGAGNQFNGETRYYDRRGQ